MSNRAKRDKLTYTVAELAEARGVCEATMLRWLRAGCCGFYINPGRTLNDGLPGAKSIRIPRAEGDAYLRRCMSVGTEQGAPAASLDSPARMDAPVGAPVGTDGVSRRRRKASGALDSLH